MPVLETVLRFLSGDVWTLKISPEGHSSPLSRTRGELINLRRPNCVSLFSGGLDSAIGALDLIKRGRMPILVSHSYTSDASKQYEIHGMLPKQLEHFSANAHPTGVSIHDVSMRTRSINFIAYGAAVAATLADRGLSKPVDLFIPENGVISLNAPLTARRIGALSTRTTHPHFISLIQQVLNLLDIPVRLVNPYSFKTKGEMLAECLDPGTLVQIVDKTVSCGKWKRKNKQCGRCVPCIIRRAALHAADINDGTPYQFKKLKTALADEDQRDDLLAVLLAIKKSHTANISQWVGLAGPLPTNATARKKHIDVFARGMAEMEAYLDDLGIN